MHIVVTQRHRIFDPDTISIHFFRPVFQKSRMNLSILAFSRIPAVSYTCTDVQRWETIYLKLHVLAYTSNDFLDIQVTSINLKQLLVMNHIYNNHLAKQSVITNELKVTSYRNFEYVSCSVMSYNTVSNVVSFISIAYIIHINVLISNF